MSFLTTTIPINRTEALPETTTREQVIALLHDRDFLIRTDALLSSYETLDADPNPKTPATLPAKYVPLKISDTKHYLIHDIVKNIPGGIWKKNEVDVKSEITDLSNGAFIRSHSPMTIVTEAAFLVSGQDGQLELLCQAELKCPKMVLGIIKGSVKNGLDEMMETILEKIRETS